MGKKLSQKEHWDSIYDAVDNTNTVEWQPLDYISRCIETVLLRAIRKYEPKSILEIGCGNSFWLPYVAKVSGATIAGIDYSESGCKHARRNLESAGVSGSIFCIDILEDNTDKIGQYDLVYSLGVIEHFSDTENILKKFSEFVKPGGVLLTEVPNLKNSFHGILAWIWQPELLQQHKKIGQSELKECYSNIKFQEINAGYCGLFSLGIVAWECYPRWPRLARLLSPLISYSNQISDRLLLRLKIFRGNRFFSPIIFALGYKT